MWDREAVEGSNGMVVDRMGLADLCDLLSSPLERPLTERQQAEVQAMIVTARRGGQIWQQVRDLAADLGVLLGNGARGSAPSQWDNGNFHSVAEVYRCPKCECGRRWVRRTGSAIPFCAVHGRRLDQSDS